MPFALISQESQEPMLATALNILVVGSLATSLNPPPNAAPKPATDMETKLVCADGDRVVYGPDFFASSRPATALPMAELVPGFVMRGGTFGCGMEGSAANVPIGGQQVPCKGEGVAVALARPQAGYVVKIVRLRGAKAGFDMGGYAEVLNVSLAAKSKTTGVVNLATSKSVDSNSRSLAATG